MNPTAAQRRPLPVPPPQTGSRTYGPSSSTNAFAIVYPEANQPNSSRFWSPSPPMNEPQARGSTFFVGRGSQRGIDWGAGGGKKIRSPLPTPTQNFNAVPYSSNTPPTAQHPPPGPPTFDARTNYAPPFAPQPLPPGAQPPSPPSVSPIGPREPLWQVQNPNYSPPPPATNNRAPTSPQTRVPVPTSSSLLIHSGFWNILAATGSRFINSPMAGTGTMSVDAGYLGLGLGEDEIRNGGFTMRRAVTSPTLMGDGAAGDKPRKKKISVGMIGRPVGFNHLVHASDADQAEAILQRWQEDGVGKIAEPGYFDPIKEATRALARSKAIAKLNIEREEQAGSLKVINGPLAPSFSGTASSVGAVENDDGYSGSSRALGVVPEEGGSPILSPIDIITTPPSPLPPSPMPFPALPHLRSPPPVQNPFAQTQPQYQQQQQTQYQGTTRFSPAKTRGQLETTPNANNAGPNLRIDQPGARVHTPSFDDPAAFEEILETGNEDFGMPKNFLPSLATIEKAVSCKVFFETHYHALLKKPRSDRETRKALLEGELSRLRISDAEKRNVRQAWVLSESEYLRDLRRRVGVGSFVKLKTIGHGAFGVVSLVKERGTGELYAMKQLRKADMLRKGQEGHVRAERDLLATAATSTRWTVRLAYSFQDVDHLYLVMTFMSGGDLLTLLIEKDVFAEDFARFYLAEMVLAIEETHKVLGAIHRDVKPDNFLFDSRGHIAISDFGLATDFHWSHEAAYFEHQRRALLQKHGIDLEEVSPHTRRFNQDQFQYKPAEDDDIPGSVLTWRDKNKRRLAYSVVGTNNYMAVEILRGQGYNFSCDWWSLGVIMFEMLYGYPPFVSKSRTQTRQKILNWKQALRFPPLPRISREAQDLISNLICEREDRLGSRLSSSISRPNSVLALNRAGYSSNTLSATSEREVDGAQSIKAHPWFKGIDFENIHLQTPPFVPQLATPTDTRYFDDDIDDNPLPAPDAIPGAPPSDATRDPMLKDKTHGAQLLDVRKQLAFQGWTFRKPRTIYDPRRGINIGNSKKPSQEEPPRGRSLLRSESGSGFARSLSI